MIKQNPNKELTTALNENSGISFENPRSVTTWPGKVDVIGVQVSEVDYRLAVETIAAAAGQGETGIVACHAVHAIVTMK